MRAGDGVEDGGATCADRGDQQTDEVLAPVGGEQELLRRAHGAAHRNPQQMKAWIRLQHEELSWRRVTAFFNSC